MFDACVVENFLWAEEAAGALSGVAGRGEVVVGGGRGWAQ